jgi:hypothetical protein
MSHGEIASASKNIRPLLAINFILIVILFYQIGGVKPAKVHFEEASKLLAEHNDLSADAYLQSLLLLTQGLVYFSEDTVC